MFVIGPFTDPMCIPFTVGKFPVVVGALKFTVTLSSNVSFALMSIAVGAGALVDQSLLYCTSPAGAVTSMIVFAIVF